MSEFLKKLQNKPLAYKRKVAIIISASITGAAFLLFLALLMANYNEYSQVKEEAKRQKAVNEEKSSLDKISDTFNTYKDEFENSPLNQQMKRNEASYASSATTTMEQTAPQDDSGASQGIIPYFTPSLSASGTTKTR